MAAAASGASAPDLLIEGILEKRGAINTSLKRRYFRLAWSDLSWFEESDGARTRDDGARKSSAADDAVPRGVIQVTHITNVRRTRSTTGFIVSTSSGRQYELVAADGSERRRWLAALDKARFHAPPATALLRQIDELASPSGGGAALLSREERNELLDRVVEGTDASLEAVRSRIAALVQAKLGGRDPDAVSVELEERLAETAAARTELELTTAMRGLHSRLCSEEVPPAFKERLVAVMGAHYAAKDGRWTPVTQQGYHLLLHAVALRIEPTGRDSDDEDVTGAGGEDLRRGHAGQRGPSGGGAGRRRSHELRQARGVAAGRLAEEEAELRRRAVSIAVGRREAEDSETDASADGGTGARAGGRPESAADKRISAAIGAVRASMATREGSVLQFIRGGAAGVPAADSRGRFAFSRGGPDGVPAGAAAKSEDSFHLHQSALLPPHLAPPADPAAPKPVPSDADFRSLCERGRFRDSFVAGDVLGRGAYSVVRGCTVRATGARMAAKFVLKTLGRDDPAAMRSLYREVRVGRRVKHPHVVAQVGLWEEREHWVLVAELMDGGELFDRIVRSRVYTERQARDTVKALAEALSYLHSHGIAHRDLKPENILLDSQEEDASLKLADLGFASVVPVDGLRTPCGTPSYVAPEILERSPYGVQVDTWSLGVIAYILLCGYPPFSSPQQHTLFRLIRAAKFRFDSPAWDGVSSAAKDLIARLLVVDPTRRLTAREVLRHPWITGTVGARQLRGVTQQMRGFGTRSNKVIKSGPLVKQGHLVRNWKERHFVLVGHALEYFERDSFRQKGSVPLREVTEVTAMSRRGTFRVATAKGYELVMQAASEATAVSWMRSITAQKNYIELMERAEVALAADRVEEAARLTQDAQRYEEYVERARRDGDDDASLSEVDEDDDEEDDEEDDESGSDFESDEEDTGTDTGTDEASDDGRAAARGRAGAGDAAGAAAAPGGRGRFAAATGAGAGGHAGHASGRSARRQSRLGGALAGARRGGAAAREAQAAGDDASDIVSISGVARNAEVFLPGGAGATPRNADQLSGLGRVAREAAAGSARRR
ncbi:hypothetical protein FNF27_07841 [Cafeteria roenbergensis]|uniref:Phosphorylase kinase n=3 Tax=Cafeteria roenbergensis TaxID=33653 RepID=A0A5A8DF38_CAFRO|nr:hypothetical protein FNF29_05483 [Cafeteria roenbergensis]KAA0164123.1 hypothetical protein FNF27_07841 [Cafeteria roenbergensis]KAA0165263.1 hypothetical protein FNF31_01916 [Cafeteria roenbergensis]KAA0165427.1 hypothetical protein FNF28_03483 [Cafeteria roenbergensis]|eukprot:KAA0150042.1 hypothetical protein FNF29_05483 [Cafeteria roenbergensis]